VANLERRKTIADELQNPLKFNIIEENHSLLAIVNKLRNEANTNRSKYKELEYLINEKNQRSVSVENVKEKD